MILFKCTDADANNHTLWKDCSDADHTRILKSTVHLKPNLLSNL